MPGSPSIAQPKTKLDAAVLRQMTVQFLARIGFNQGNRIWIKLSWDLPPALAPRNWSRYDRKGTTHLRHLLYCGKVTRQGFTLHPCRPKGKDERGITRWQVSRRRCRDGWQYCFNQSKRGATVCFYPNQPQTGIGNRHVQACNTLFYEIDDLPLQAQVDAIRILKQRTRLQPTAVVFSGGKSLHVYLRSSEPLKPQQWLEFNRKICILQGGDPQICNAARAMRLPGMIRRKVIDGKLTKPTAISLKASRDQAYTPSELEAALDQTGLFPHGLDDARWRQWVKLTKQAKADETLDPLSVLLESKETAPGQCPTPAPESSWAESKQRTHPQRRASGIVPLADCLTREDQEHIHRGVGEGNRNGTGYKLARNLIGTTEFLRQVGVRFEPSDPRALFDTYGDRCSPPLDPVEADRIWQSAQSRPASPSRTPESIQKTIDYWQRKAQDQSNLRRWIKQVRANQIKRKAR